MGGLQDPEPRPPQQDGRPPGGRLPLPLLPLAARHRDPPRAPGAVSLQIYDYDLFRYSSHGSHVCGAAGAGAQGDGAVPGRAADQQGRPEGGPPVTGEHPQ